jgi:hypothetical protein
MQKILIAALAAAIISGAAFAQTSPTRPASPTAQNPAATGSQPSRVDVQRCEQMTNAAEKQRCMNGLQRGSAAPANRSGPTGSGAGAGSPGGTVGHSGSGSSPTTNR